MLPEAKTVSRFLGMLVRFEIKVRVQESMTPKPKTASFHNNKGSPGALSLV
jgi:hypothetical protein